MTEEGGLSDQLRNLLYECRARRSSLSSPLVVTISGSGEDKENEFYYKLIEEKHEAFKKAHHHESYSDFWNTF